MAEPEPAASDVKSERPKIVERVLGLDSIRFICAAIVLFGHFELFPVSLQSDIKTVNLFIEGTRVLFNGPAAVIVFFIVSGYCIHRPQYARGAGSVEIGKFYARRMVRIGIPALAALVLYILTRTNMEYPTYGVLWSIICEIVYYLLYPLLLALRVRFGWIVLIAVSTFAAAIAAVWQMDAHTTYLNAYAALGNWTWLIGLPVWLIGCWLAETADRALLVSTFVLWVVRLGVFLASAVLRVVKFHVDPPFGSNVLWLSLFAILVAAWIALEVRYWMVYEPAAWLENAGKWSYSLYLVHPITLAIMVQLGVQSVWGHWAFILGSLALSYLFYLAVELPSHRLAGQVGKVRQTRTA